MKKYKLFYQTNIFYALILRLVIVLIFLSLSRICIYIFNQNLFSGFSLLNIFEAFIIGLRFDISAISILASIYILANTLPLGFRKNSIYQKTVNSITIFSVSIAIIFNFIDVVYYRFTLKRITFDFFRYIKSNDGFIDVAPQFITDFWSVSLTAIICIVLFIWLFTRVRLNKKIEKKGWRFYSINLLISVLTAGLIVLGIRGGTQLKPISIVDAGLHVPAQLTPLVLNTPFTIIKSFGKSSLEMKTDFTEKELEEIFNPIHSYSPVKNVPGNIKNVVILILESFSSEHIGYFTHNKTFTPFLDSLFGHSLVFNGVANGKRSRDGIPAILSSLPNLSDDSFISSSYAANLIESLALNLNKRKYKTAFFHGGKNGTMNFDSYANCAGFQEYYGLNEYPDKADFDGKWGIWDDQYLQYFAEKLDNFNKPFFATVFTLSSHHPYKIPEKYVSQLPEGRMQIQKSIAYTDLAVRNFFEKIKNKKWYNNTLFIITADHTSEGGKAKYKNAFGQFSIPIAFFAPADTIMKKRSAEIPVQQIDIFPSVIQYLGINDTILCFGNSVFEKVENRFVINHYNHQIQILDSTFLLQVHKNISKSIYNYKTDSLLENNLINKCNDKPLLKIQKAFIQQYNNRMINNKLIVSRKNRLKNN